MAEMAVRDFCRTNPCTAAQGETVREAAKRMAARGVGSLVVVDDAGRPIGMLTDRDVVVRVLRQHLSPDTTTVGEVMQRELSKLREGAPLVNALRRMRSDGVRRLPVVDDEGSLMGIISADDVLQLVTSELSDIAGVVRAQFPADLSGEHALASDTGVESHA
jgi:CBS domain-containing protein